MVCILATLKVKKGKEELFEKIFVELSENVREVEKGNIFYQISKDREIENTYIVMEDGNLNIYDNVQVSIG